MSKGGNDWFSFRWPIVDERMRLAALAQLEEALSIYDEEGVYGRFEDCFREYTGHEFVLSTCSGTAALHSAYYGLGIGPGDEVVACDYGFFASVTPAIQLGARVVFVDCRDDGCVDPSAVEDAISPRSKAVVATHMWGAAADMHTLREICSRRKVALVEDCSHAHGTRLFGQVAGSFGDVSAWSLQGKKTVWAGEGGVLATNDRSIFERALLLGHFNQRAERQIHRDSKHAQYAFTGTGLKYRAHPIGIALALAQMPLLDEVVEGRQAPAAALASALESLDGVSVISRSSCDLRHTYYSLVARLDRGANGQSVEELVGSLRERGMFFVGRPRQMTSMSAFPVFDHEGSRSVFRVSRAISDESMNLFVPSLASSNVDEHEIDRACELIAGSG